MVWLPLLLLQPTAPVEVRERANQIVVERLIELGNALDCGHPPEKFGRFRALGFLTRSHRYLTILTELVSIPKEMRPRLSEHQCLRFIHFSELALEYALASLGKVYRSGSKGKEPTWQYIQRTNSVMAARALVATAHMELNPGDTARNLERARDQFKSIVEDLKAARMETSVLGAAAAGVALARAVLDYPSELPRENAKTAIEILTDAIRLVEPFAASAKAPPAEITSDREAWLDRPAAERFRLALPYASRLEVGRTRARRKGVVDPVLAGYLIPSHMFRANWQLGNAYRTLGDLESALHHFDLALQSFPHDPDGQAALLVDKGFVYLESEAGERKQNLFLAVECFRKVMQNQKRIRLERNVILAGLGYARAQLALDGIGALKADVRAKVLAGLASILRTTASAARDIEMTQVVQEAAFHLGVTYELLGDNYRAYLAYVIASRVNERLKRRARTFRLKSFWVSSGAPIYDRLIGQALRFAYSKMLDESAKGYKKELDRRRRTIRVALAFAERGRTVLLREELSNRDLLPKGASREALGTLHDQRRSLRAAELRVLQHEWSPDPGTEVEAIPPPELRARRAELETEYLRRLQEVRSLFNDPSYDPDEPIGSASYKDIEVMVADFPAGERVAFVEYYVADRYVVVFTILPPRRGGGIRWSVTTSRLSRQTLDQLGLRWVEGLSNRVHPAQLEGGYLPQILKTLRVLIEKPVETISEWEQKNNQRIGRVIVVPHRYLHLLPLHAVPLPDGTPWGDRITVQYVPSATVLVRVLRSWVRSPYTPVDYRLGRLGYKAVCISYSDPSDEYPLNFDKQETQSVVAETGAELLLGQDATPGRVKEAISEAGYIHFVCHGVFSRKSPLDTHLRLAPEKDVYPCGISANYAPLTLGDIFCKVQLPKTRLVVLSSCETGQTRIERLHEEYISLPSGFLYAGAQTVVSSLWPVSDLATWLLMRTFLKEIASGSSSSLALRNAQRSLRELPREAILQEVTAVTDKEQDTDKRRRMVAEGQQLGGDYPFASPYWWAGFVIHGLGN
jgi:CHAT domain-containing protein/tetratricopeptide (TPR) repeat protein